MRVFCDEYAKATLRRSDFYIHLNRVYEYEARYTVLFASTHDAEKIWTSHERKTAQVRAISEREECILPARFDESDIPGHTHMTGCVDPRRITSVGLVDLIIDKIGRRAGSWVGLRHRRPDCDCAECSILV